MSSVNRRVTALASLVLGGLGTELVILMCCCDVTESGVWLLTPQKPIKRQIDGKKSLLYFGCQQWGREWEEGQTAV